MHQSQSIINRIWYGFDLKTVYLRADFNSGLDNQRSHKDLLLLFDFSSLNLKIEIPLFAPKIKARLLAKDLNQNYQEIKEITAVSFDKILEIALDFSDLKVQEKEIIDFFITLENQGFILERCPLRSFIRIKIPSPDYESYSWSA